MTSTQQAEPMAGSSSQSTGACETIPEPPPRRAHQSGGTTLTVSYFEEQFRSVKLMITSFQSDVTQRILEFEQKIESRLFDLEQNNDKLKQTINTQQKEIQDLKDKLVLHEHKLKIAERDETENEQYSRKSSVRIFGLSSGHKNEDAKRVVCDFVNTKLQVAPPLREDDIDVAHRVGAPSAKNTQTMLCKFLKRTDKMRVLKCRSKLKGSGVSIGDDITKKHLEYMDELKKRPDISQIWFWNGKLFAKPVNCENFFNPRLYCDVDKLIQETKARPVKRR